MPRPAEFACQEWAGFGLSPGLPAHPPVGPVDTSGVSERTWGNTWRYVAGIAGCLVLAYFPFVSRRRVPLLGLVDLGFHELGHLVTRPFPDVFTAAMGSVTQVLVPLGIALYFWLARHDLMAGGLCLAWAGTSARDAAVYIADAPYQRLTLIGGEHDWAFVLGPSHLNLLDKAGLIAGVVTAMAIVFVAGGVFLCVVGLLRRGEPAAPPASGDGSTWVRPPARIRHIPPNVLGAPVDRPSTRRDVLELP